MIVLAAALIPSTALAIMARDYGATFIEHQPEVLRCARGAEGMVTLQLHVAPSGQLNWSRVSSAQPASMRAAGQCILRRARAWHFAPSTSGGWRTFELSISGGAISLRSVPPPEPYPN